MARVRGARSPWSPRNRWSRSTRASRSALSWPNRCARTPISGAPRCAPARSSCCALVGIPQPEAIARSYPHQLSGGMAQRVAIALALAAGPNLLIADEPTTALDPTIQAEILDLLRSLQAELGMAIVLVTHDLGVVADIATRPPSCTPARSSNRPRGAAARRPAHPYTRGLLDAMPDPQAGDRGLRTVAGSVPLPQDWPTCCRFEPRCPLAIDACRSGGCRCRTSATRRWRRRRRRAREPCVRAHELVGRGGTAVSEALLAVENLRVDVQPPRRRAAPCSGRRRDLRDRAGETVGLVGESGSGKSTIGRAVLGLAPIARAAAHHRRPRHHPQHARDRAHIAGDLQVIFQDPYGSLNPARTDRTDADRAARVVRPRAGATR